MGDSPFQSKEYDATERLASVVAYMRQHRIARYSDGVIEIELHPSAFLPAQQNLEPTGPQLADPDKCDCSHSLQTEHNETGCLRGCAAETCATTGQVRGLA